MGEISEEGRGDMGAWTSPTMGMIGAATPADSPGAWCGP